MRWDRGKHAHMPLSARAHADERSAPDDSAGLIEVVFDLADVRG
jgi:hypothetical protein